VKKQAARKSAVSEATGDEENRKRSHAIGGEKILSKQALIVAASDEARSAVAEKATKSEEGKGGKAWRVAQRGVINARRNSFLGAKSEKLS